MAVPHCRTVSTRRVGPHRPELGAGAGVLMARVVPNVVLDGIARDLGLAADIQ